MTENPRSLLVADSFRVRLNADTGQAEVRGWHRHLDRFRAGVGAAHPSLEQESLEAFLVDAAHVIQNYGEGFPRLELWGSPDETPELAVALRPLPTLNTEIELHTASGVVLETPSRKGPNIARLATLNQKLGGEALLVDLSCRVLEGATTSLIWWDPADQKGYVVANEVHRVASVTEALLRDTAAFVPGSIPPGNLTGCEVWALNALHGIRVVTAIDGMPTLLPNPKRLTRLKTLLDRLWEPVI